MSYKRLVVACLMILPAVFIISVLYQNPALDQFRGFAKIFDAIRKKGASPQSSCTNVIISMSPCLNYMEGNSSTPSPSCCLQLSTVFRSQPECLCQVLSGGGSSLGLSINQTRALQLPNDCNIQTPHISQCNVANPPADAPAGTLEFVISEIANPPADAPAGTSDSPTTSVPGSEYVSSNSVDEHKDKLPDGPLSAGFDEKSCNSLCRNCSFRSPPKTDLGRGSEDASFNSTDEHKDKLLDGLLSAGFDEKSCLSRYQSFLYRKSSPHKPSSYLQSRLRKYEDLHKKCGPNTESYNKAVEKLKSGKGHHTGPTDCSYVIWVSFSGLGNRMISLASTFLYALLTNRVLLVERAKDMDYLFCEPFPKNSWLLPLDSPLSPLKRFYRRSSQSDKITGGRNVTNNMKTSLPPVLYLHLLQDYDNNDKLFFCDQEQSLLRKIPWLILRTNNYIVPSLFLIPSFKQELSKLFPSKVTVFHHLGRYLFHPSNTVWGIITRYYETYLAKADERVGIQIRVFDRMGGAHPFQHVSDQIVACFLGENLLPQVNPREPILVPFGNRKSKAVLITSLTPGYFENIRDMYLENPTVSGDMIGVYQPSHEEHQHSERTTHNEKAWAEIYLLSLTDVLMTSSWSTFGYVAQGLAGLKPWMLYKFSNHTRPGSPCRRAISMEPCFHLPPSYDCKGNSVVDTGAIVPYVRHCEDRRTGIKLVEGD